MDDKQRLAQRSSSRLPSLSASATPSIRKDREALAAGRHPWTVREQRT
jgi:hypothetical protein